MCKRSETYLFLSNKKSKSQVAFLVTLFDSQRQLPRRWLLHYRPQRSWGKVMFLHVSVILFTVWGGGCLVPGGVGISACTEADPPGAVHAGRYGQHAGGRYPTGMHSCLLFYFFIRQKRKFGLFYIKERGRPLCLHVKFKVCCKVGHLCT